MTASRAAVQMDLPAVPRVVHSLPGRVRLRCDSDGRRDVALLAARLRAHPSVRLVTVVPSIGSLTVHFDPACPFQDLISSLPDATPPGGAPVQQFEMDWARVALSCVLALLPLGPVCNVALALVTSAVEQARDAERSAGLADSLLGSPGARQEALAPTAA